MQGQGKPQDGEGTRENDTLAGPRGPEQRREHRSREASRKRPVAALSFAHPLHPHVGGRRWGPHRRGGDPGENPSLGLGSLPQPVGRGRRQGSKAAGGHFSCGAAENHGGPPRPQTSADAGSRPTGAAPRREPGGAGEAVGPGPRRAGAAGQGPARGRPPAGSRRRSEQGERREGGSRYLYWAAAAAAAAPLWVNPK